MPAAPATQPRPTSGIRFTSGRSPTWAAIRDSSDGTASPVTVAEITRSTSLGVSPAALRASTSAREPSSTACSMKRSLAWPKSREPGVLVERQHVCRCSHAGVGVEAPQQPLVEAAAVTNPGEGVGDVLLGVAVARKRAADGQDPHVGSSLLVRGSG